MIGTEVFFGNGRSGRIISFDAKTACIRTENGGIEFMEIWRLYADQRYSERAFPTPTPLYS